MDGRVAVSNAAVCLTEVERLRHRLRPEAVPTVWEGLLVLAGLEGSAGDPGPASGAAGALRVG